MTVEEELHLNRSGKRPREEDEYDNLDVEYMLTQAPKDEKKRENKIRKKLQSQELRQSQSTQNIAGQSEEYAGYIKRVTLRNFMSHANFELELIPRLNFIIGHNGSGKSAILTAICVCLGAKATDTNRGSSLKNLIKEGTNSSTVTVVLNNTGDDALDQTKYGKEIIIERTIKRDKTTSPYIIKSQSGKRISNKKSDLLAILDFFNIAVGNPMSFLSQDAARSFLTASTDEQKYNYFMKGTQMEEIMTNLSNSGDELTRIGLKLVSMKDNLQGLKKKEEVAGALYERINSAEKINDEIRRVTGKFAWVQTDELANQIKLFQQKIEEYDRVKIKFQVDLGNLESELTVVNQEIVSTKSQHKTLLKDYEDAQNNYQDHKSNAEKVIQKAENARNELERANQELKSLQKTMGSVERDIHVEIERINRAQGGSREVLEAQYQQLEEKSKATSTEITNLTEQLTAIEENGSRELVELESKIRSLGQKIKDQADYIKDIKQAQSNSDPLLNYPVEYKNLVRMINENKKRFRSPPIGPLGRYISIKPEHSAWAKYIDTSLGMNLNIFIVQNYQDLHLLSQFGKKCNCDAEFVCRKFEKFNYSHGLPDQRYQTILDVLEFQNEDVKYSLIDLCKIESTVLACDRQEGERIIQEKTHNIRQTIAMFPGVDGKPDSIRTCSMNANDSFRSDPKTISRGLPKIIVKNLSDEIPQLERSKIQLEKEFTDVQSEARKVSARTAQKKSKIQVNIKTNQEALKAIERDIYQAKKKLDSDTDNGRLNELEIQRSEIKSQIDFCTGTTIPAAESTFQETESKKVNVHNDYKMALSQVTKIKQSKKLIEEFLSDKSEQKHVLSQKIEKFHYTLEALEQKKASKLEAIEQKEAQINEQSRSAAVVCSREEADTIVTNDLQSLKMRIQKLKKDLDNASRDLGKPVEQIVNEYIKAKEEHKQAQQTFDTVRTFRNELKSALDHRVQTFRSSKHTTFVVASYDFEKSLAFRGFKGRLQFEDQKKKLTMSVRTKNDKEARHVDSLSGGEKSFSQIAFLLATWKPMRSRIKGLDEFDVFMDQVNRKIGMRLMLSKLSKENKAQTIFITPQDIGQIVDFDEKLVKIHRIKDPRANQH